MSNLNTNVTVTTVTFDSWINESTVQTKKKNQNAPPVIYKVFEECSKVVNDPFWINKFKDAMIGKFPSRFSFRDGVLIYRKGSKNQTLEIPQDIREAAYKCIEFFKINGGIFSPLDEQKSLELQNQNSKIELKWNSSKKIQQMLLDYYYEQVKSSLNLSYKEVKQLKETVQIGIINKYFNKNNICIENNRITNIEGLLWDSENHIFYIDPIIKSRSTKYKRRNIESAQKDVITEFIIKWKKYIELINNKINKYERKKIIIKSSSLDSSSNTSLCESETVTNSTED